MDRIPNPPSSEQENPYLLLGIVQFGIIATLMVVFFPWSLLLCVVFLGMDKTILLIAAMLHDFVKSVLAVLATISVIAVIILIVVVLINS